MGTINSPTGENLNHLSGSEVIALRRLAQMLGLLYGNLVTSEGLTDPVMIKDILAKATPELTREAFDGSGNSNV